LDASAIRIPKADAFGGNATRNRARHRDTASITRNACGAGCHAGTPRLSSCGSGFGLCLLKVHPSGHFLPVEITFARKRLLRERGLGGGYGTIGRKLRSIPAFDDRQRLAGTYGITEPFHEPGHCASSARGHDCLALG
jgi:hypothetical protein